MPGLDGLTTAKESYRVSQKIRKRVEEIFGCIKTVGGMQRSRYRGKERTQARGCFVSDASNLPRMALSSLAGARWTARRGPPAAKAGTKTRRRRAKMQPSAARAGGNPRSLIEN